MLATNPVLVATGMTFLIPAVAALHGNAIIAAIASLNLMATTIVYHWSKDQDYYWIDQIAIFLYIVAIVYEAFFKRRMFHQILVGVICIYTTCLHHYGYMHTCYIWDDDCSTATHHHAAMHFVAALAGALTFLVE